MLRMNTITVFALFALAAFTTACGEDVMEEGGDPRDENFLVAVDGKADVPNTIHENSPEARAILRVVNSYSRHGLVSDADVYWKSARFIIDYREGKDETLNTDDDHVVFTLAELDAIPYVGKTAFRRLRAHVNAADLIVFDDVVISEVVPEVINTQDHTIVRAAIGKREKINIKLEGEIGDRVLMLLRKADDKKWNPKLTIVDLDSDEILTMVNPWGTADARLPVLNDEQGRGWEIDREGAEIQIVLQNTNYEDGLFEFVVECIGGPCAANTEKKQDNRELTELQDDELRARLVGNHQENHLRISYYNARMEMFSSLDNRSGDVECVYTGTVVETDTIPSNLEMNAEHTWPQSQGAIDGSAKSDLHHIYPVTSMINSLRGAAPYCEVTQVIREMDGATLGYDVNGKRCFEPRDSHKGNAARAMFYFAVVYQQSIPDDEEAVLRTWADRDPIDGTERIRAARIKVFQGSNQPFIDNPELLGNIADF